MRLILLFLFFFSIKATKSIGQKNPSKIGIIKEFTGIVENVYLYQGDNYFSIKDAKHGTVTFFVDSNMDDEFELDCEMDEGLHDEIYGYIDQENKIKVIVRAKSAYGWVDHGDGIKKKFKKQIIWRPVKVTKLK
jgi:hypothetical protein